MGKNKVKVTVKIKHLSACATPVSTLQVEKTKKRLLEIEEHSKTVGRGGRLGFCREKVNQVSEFFGRLCRMF